MDIIGHTVHRYHPHRHHHNHLMGDVDGNPKALLITVITSLHYVLSLSCSHWSPRVHLHVVGMLRLMSLTSTNRACPLLFILFSCLFLSLRPFQLYFHSINSPDNSPLSHSVLAVLSLPHWSFQLYVSLRETLPQP